MSFGRHLADWGKRARLAAGLGLALVATPAAALDVVLNDVAGDRVERQRAYTRGEVPFAGTPDLARLDDRLAAKGLAKGSPIFIRIFKETSELEIWMRKDKTFILLDTYPICHWTGTLGPKLKEGDKQSPEGFYSVAARQMRPIGRWQKAFNIGFPNLHDQLNKRTGSFILVHGGCSSVGCFAMTEQVQEEIYELAAAALKAGQERFHVHIFPFRMTDAAMADPAHAGHAWAGFWRELKPGYDSFERTHIPPHVAVCEQRYYAADGAPGGIGEIKPLAMLRPQPSGDIAGGGATACMFDWERQGKQVLTLAPTKTEPAEPQAGSPRRKPANAVVQRERQLERERPAESGPRQLQAVPPNGFGDADRRSGGRAVSGG